MPTISVFFGIVITMYWREHEPAHFHARYGEFEAIIAIETLEVLRGSLPRRALALAREWAAAHRERTVKNLGKTGVCAERTKCPSRYNLWSDGYGSLECDGIEGASWP